MTFHRGKPGHIEEALLVSGLGRENFMKRGGEKNLEGRH